MSAKKRRGRATSEAEALRSGVLAECLFRADRLDELMELKPLTSRVQFWQGAGLACLGRFEEALKAWRAVQEAEPESRPAREALARLLRHKAFCHAKDSDWEEASSALDRAQQEANRDGLLVSSDTPIVEAMVFLMAGKRQEAVRILQEALRQNPTDGRLAHTFGLACYHTARALEEQGQMEEAHGAWERAIAAWVMLMCLDGFWEEWRSEIQARYRANVPNQALAGVKNRVGAHLEAILSGDGGPASEEGVDNWADGPMARRMLVQRELRAAHLLAELGGFSPPGTDDQNLVCGPLMIQCLGLECAFGDFASRLPVRRERPIGSFMEFLRMLLGEDVEASFDERLPDLTQTKHLRRYFSQLGIAQALVDMGNPQEVLMALSQASCPRCRKPRRKAKRTGSRTQLPALCKKTCPDFDKLNPGYASLQKKRDQLQTDALELAIQARLDLAQSCITASTIDTKMAATHWKAAIQLSKKGGIQEKTEHRIVETALGRVQALEQRRRLDDAVALLKAAEGVCEDRFDRELVGRLAETLADRGIAAANETPPRWEAAVADLRRAIGFNPHAPRPLINLGIALRGLAVHRYEQDRPGDAIDALTEAMKLLKDGLARIPGHGMLKDQYEQVQEELAHVYNNWGVDLANAGRYERALKVTRQGLREFPQDAAMRTNLRAISNGRAVQLANGERFADALDVLEQALREFPGDGQLRENKRNILLAHAVRLFNSGEMEQSAAVLERGLREFPNDQTMAQNLAQVRAMMAMMGRRQW